MPETFNNKFSQEVHKPNDPVEKAIQAVKEFWILKGYSYEAMIDNYKSIEAVISTRSSDANILEVQINFFEKLLVLIESEPAGMHESWRQQKSILKNKIQQLEKKLVEENKQN